METEKVKRLERIGQKQRAIAKNVRNFTKRMSVTDKFDNKYVREPHRLAKYNCMGCAGPNCIGCRNPRKIFGEPTIAERRFDQTKLHDE